MKTLATFLGLAVLFFLASCKKETASADPGSWMLGSTTYKVGYSAKTQTSTGTTLLIFSDVVLTGNNPTANTLVFTFKTVPTASGTYQLISSAGTLAANQVQVSAGSQANAYGYIGANVNVDVTVTGGKIKVVVPQLSMLNTAGGANANLTATVQEQ